MIWVTIAAVAIAAGSGYVAYTQIRRARRLSETVRQKAKRIGELHREIESRNDTINEMERANAEAQEQKQSTRRGTDRERLDTANDILRDDPEADDGR